MVPRNQLEHDEDATRPARLQIMCAPIDPTLCVVVVWHAINKPGRLVLENSSLCRHAGAIFQVGPRLVFARVGAVALGQADLCLQRQLILEWSHDEIATFHELRPLSLVHVPSCNRFGCVATIAFPNEFLRQLRLPRRAQFRGPIASLKMCLIHMCDMCDCLPNVTATTTITQFTQLAHLPLQHAQKQLRLRPAPLTCPTCRHLDHSRHPPH